jgi:hypothetical protein
MCERVSEIPHSIPIFLGPVTHWRREINFTDADFVGASMYTHSDLYFDAADPLSTSRSNFESEFWRTIAD